MEERMTDELLDFLGNKYQDYLSYLSDKNADDLRYTFEQFVEKFVKLRKTSLSGKVIDAIEKKEK
jgi:hypothetical protein